MTQQMTSSQLIALSTNDILRYAGSLTVGEIQDRPLAARIYQGLSYFHPTPAACLLPLAQLYEEGQGGVERDLTRRFHILRYCATELEHELGQYLLCFAYLKGEGTERNELIAVAGFERIWEGEGRYQFDAALMLGRIFMDGIGLVVADPRRAVELFDLTRNYADDDYTRVAATGHMAELLREGAQGVPIDAARAMQVYLEAVNLDDNAYIVHELATMYENGEGIDEPSLEEARKWYEEAAEQGYGPSIDHLQEL